MDKNITWKLINKDFINLLCEKKYYAPNLVQVDIFENLNKKSNSIIVAPTGTGKTFALVVYLIDYLSVNKNIKAFFVLPTKELIDQVYDICKELKIKDLIKITNLNKIKNIESIISTNLILTTPNKLDKFAVDINSHMKKFSFFLILDEVDTLIEMGFLNGIQKFIKLNNSLFKKKIALSATIPKGLMQQLKIWFKTSNNYISANKKITKSDNYFVITREEKKQDDLIKILKFYKNHSSTIVFFNTKQKLLAVYQWVIANSEIRPILIHGSLQEKVRIQTMNIIKNQENIIIFSSDLLARGISIKHLQTVVNYSLPKDNIWYMHRSGRTGRYNQPGQIVSLIYEKEIQKINELTKKGINFFEAKININGLNLKKTKLKKTIINSDLKNKIKKIVNTAPKKIKPNYRKKIKNEIKKAYAKAKRKNTEAKIKQQLIKKWKLESIAKRIKKEQLS